MHCEKWLGVLSILLAVVFLAPTTGAAEADLCGALQSSDVAKALGPDWRLVSAAPLGGAQTCYGTFRSGAKQRMFGITVHPAGGGTYDGVVQFLQSPKPIAGIGDKAMLGTSGSSATLVVSKNNKTYSFGGGPSAEQLQRAAQVMLTQLP